MWVDNADALHHAICHIEECKVVGIDCEWKPNYIKGKKPNKVIIDKLYVLCKRLSPPLLSYILVSAPIVFYYYFFNLIRTLKLCICYFAPLD